MKTQNFVQLIGYLADDPVMRTAVNGSKLARLRMATDYYRKEEDGTEHKKTTWHEIKAWDGLAHLVPGNFIKGSHMLVQGEIEHRSYVNSSGDTRYVTEIRASEILNLDR